jgi:death-on-curing protein
MPRPLNIAHIEFLSHRVARERLRFDEPIPEFASRRPGILESCLAQPFARFGGKDLYSGLIGKAAMLFYLMIKNHPFVGGDKRTAMTTLLTFLYYNSKWLKVADDEFYDFSVWIASSAASLKDEAVSAAEVFIREHMCKLEDAD